jgi:acyl-CoA reductase-like NAD-dependent aldehyde dehydrogenase
MEHYPVYVGGEFIHTTTTISVNNPFNGKEIAQISLAGAAELESAILKALAVKPLMRDMPSGQKYEILMTMARKTEQKRQYLSEILSAESAKPIKYALGETDRAVATLIAAAEEAKRLPKEYIDLEWTAGGKGKEGLLRYFPVGIVAGITPFNFPLNLAIHKIAPAIAAGCPIILKPSSSTPLSMLEFAKIAHESGLPAGALSILPMDRALASNLITDPRINLITFTGSPPVGWKIKQDCGKKRVTLELGGNAGVIITETADLDLAVSKCVMGAFSYSGQVCIHTQRIYVHQSIFDAFRQKFTEATAKLVQGDPADPKTDISAMIDEANAIRVESWVNEAVEAGASLLGGGKRDGTYFEPTILTHTKQDMKVSCCEVFGPVVTLEPYHDFNDVIPILNHGEFGLQAGVFTNKISEMNYAFREIEAGGIIINDVPTFRVDHMPYGGIKNSGFGREGVKYAIFEMLEPRLLVKNF